MALRDESRDSRADGSAFPWILEHLLAYPGTYEIPLRTMYTLNCASLNQQTPNVSPIQRPGNAFPRHAKTGSEGSLQHSSQQQQQQQQQQQMSTATAAAQLKANLMTHISQLSSQPASLPPSFIISFVRRCFTPELNQVDFPQALTAMDYLKDLEVRRRAEILAALDKLGVDRGDIGHRDQMVQKYPGVSKWIDSVEGKERKVEALYSQIYVGLRKWTLINEMSLTPFNKSNCIAMLNTLYPPMGISSNHFVQPTAQLTAALLSEQRNGFFRYITAVEKKGSDILASLIQQHKRPGDESGYSSLRENLDHYLRMAGGIIDECNEVTGYGGSPTSASFSSADYNDEHRRKIDSGISFGYGHASNRSSGQSHGTRTSTCSSASAHSRQASKEKQLPEKPLPAPGDDSRTTPPSPRAASSTLERIARELRKMRSRGNVREESRSQLPTSHAVREEGAAESEASTAPHGKTLRLKRSLKKMRSASALRDSSTSRPASRDVAVPAAQDMPAFDEAEMRKRRQAWEDTQQRKQDK